MTLGSHTLDDTFIMPDSYPEGDNPSIKKVNRNTRTKKYSMLANFVPSHNFVSNIFDVHFTILAK